MSVTVLSTNQTFGELFSLFVTAVRRKIEQSMEERRRVYRTEDELIGCTDRELADMGLGRYDIALVARASVDGYEPRDNYERVRLEELRSGRI